MADKLQLGFDAGCSVDACLFRGERRQERIVGVQKEGRSRRLIHSLDLMLAGCAVV